MGTHVIVICDDCKTHYDFMRRSVDCYSLNGRTNRQLWDFVNFHSGHNLRFYLEGCEPERIDYDRHSEWEEDSD